MTAEPLKALRTRMAASLRRERLSPLATAGLAMLGAASAISALFAGWALLDPEAPAVAAKSEWRPPAPPALASPFSHPPGPNARTLSRPIFDKSRRPKSGATAVGARVEPAAPLRLRLAAIIRDGDGARVYLVTEGAAEGEWHALGGSAGEWRIEEIRQFEIVLKSGSRTAELRLYPEVPN